MPILIIEFTPKRADFSKAIRLMMQVNNRKTVWIVVVFLAIFTAFSTIAAIQGTSTGFFFLFFFLVTVLPIMAVRMLYFTPINLDEKLLGLTQWTLEEDSLIIKMPSVETTIDWDTYQDVLESQDFYFLVQKSSQRFFHFLPKSAFATRPVEDHFRNFITDRYGEIKQVPNQVGSRIALVVIGILYLINICLLFYANFSAVLN